MAETDSHVKLITETTGKLQRHFLKRGVTAYVAGNNFVYYQPRPKMKRVSPDTYVVFGVEQRDRNSYMTWLEDGRMPDVVFEFTSEGTRRNDTGMNGKLGKYQNELKVYEYFLYDPTADYIESRLRGYRLVDGLYQAIPLVGGEMESMRLGLILACDGVRMNLYTNTHPRQKLLSGQEEADRADAANAQAETERTRADAERKLRIAEEARADKERKQRIAEEARADALAEELENLRRRLAT